MVLDIYITITKCISVTALGFERIHLKERTQINVFVGGHFEVSKKAKKCNTLDALKAICHAILQKTTSKVGRRRHL